MRCGIWYTGVVGDVTLMFEVGAVEVVDAIGGNVVDACAGDIRPAIKRAKTRRQIIALRF